jgi:hypothetical protein
LDFLLGVMADPTADSEQRVKAAAVAARYKHAVAAPDPEAPSIVVADKFGFTVAPDLARAERDDRLREATLRTILHLQKHLRKKESSEAKAAEQELEQASGAPNVSPGSVSLTVTPMPTARTTRTG